MRKENLIKSVSFSVFYLFCLVCFSFGEYNDETLTSRAAQYLSHTKKGTIELVQDVDVKGKREARVYQCYANVYCYWNVLCPS